MKARDVMTSPAVSVGPDTPFKEIVAILVEKRISAVPVVDEEVRVIGLVSEADLLAKEEERPRPRFRLLSLLTSGPEEVAERTSRAEGLVARDLMTPAVVTVDEETDVKEVARTLSKHGIKRVPVTRNGKLVGIVSRSDVLKVFLRRDEEIRQEILEDVLPRKLLVDPRSVHVDVRDGVVTLRGMVDRKSTRDVVEHFIERLDGVVGVVNELEFELDDSRLKPASPPRSW